MILSLTWAGTFLPLRLCQLSWLVQGDCLSTLFWIHSLLLLMFLCYLQSTGWRSSLYRHPRSEFRQWSTSLCRFPVVQTMPFLYFLLGRYDHEVKFTLFCNLVLKTQHYYLSRGRPQFIALLDQKSIYLISIALWIQTDFRVETSVPLDIVVLLELTLPIWSEFWWVNHYESCGIPIVGCIFSHRRRSWPQLPRWHGHGDKLLC